MSPSGSTAEAENEYEDPVSPAAGPESEGLLGATLKPDSSAKTEIGWRKKAEMSAIDSARFVEVEKRVVNEFIS
jgi:hypothetical protein